MHLSKFSQGAVKVHVQGKANLNRGFINADYREKTDATPPIAELGRRLDCLKPNHILPGLPNPLHKLFKEASNAPSSQTILTFHRRSFLCGRKNGCGTHCHVRDRSYLGRAEGPRKPWLFFKLTHTPARRTEAALRVLLILALNQRCRFRLDCKIGEQSWLRRVSFCT